MNRPLLFVAAVLLLFWGVIALSPEPPYTPHQPSAEYVAAAKEYREKNLSPMPVNWEWDYFTAEDGKKMRWGVAAPDGPIKATVIFVPGYAGALEMYAD